MIFFMAMPFLTGLINIVVPQQIGTRDVAFPFLNSVSLWLTTAGAGLVMVSLVIGKFSTAGWTGYPPYSGAEFNPGVGVDYWIWALMIGGVGSTLTGINFIATILKRRAPGMTLDANAAVHLDGLLQQHPDDVRLPRPHRGVRHAGARPHARHALLHERRRRQHDELPQPVLDLGASGSLHLDLPAFGIYSEVVATFSAKRLFGYELLVYATAVIAILSFTVWLHHFFTMGSSANVNAVFGVATMIIAVPTGVKVFDWLLTMYRGRILFHPSMLWTLGFIVTFVIGGMTGVLLAMPPADYLMHNTTFLVAHFLDADPRALFGYFAGYMYWFPKAFGFTLNERWGVAAFWFWLIGFYLAFMPLYVLGFMGMPRRMEHYYVAAWQPYLVVAAMGAVLVMIGIACLVVQVAVSVRQRHQAARSQRRPVERTHPGVADVIAAGALQFRWCCRRCGMSTPSTI